MIEYKYTQYYLITIFRVEIGAKEVGFWQQNSKKLELLIIDLQMQLKNQEKKYINYKMTSEQMLNDALKKERQKFEIELQQRLTHQRGFTNTSANDLIKTVNNNSNNNRTAENLIPKQEIHNVVQSHKTSTKVYDGIIEDLRLNLNKKDVIIQRLATQLALARGNPVLQVLKEGYDSLGHDLDLLKQKQIYGAKTVDQMVANHNDKQRGLQYVCVNNILEEYQQTMNDIDEYEENQSQNSYEIRQHKELVKVKRGILQEEVDLQLGARQQNIDMDKSGVGVTRPSSAPSVIRHIRESRSFAPRDVKKVTLLDRYDSRQLEKSKTIQ